MKKIVVFLLLTAFSGLMYAQEKKCSQPLSNNQYQQKYTQIKNVSPESSKLQFALRTVRAYCFSCEQIKEILSLFDDDNDKLELAKVAYNNVFDKENFYDVYDAFIYYSVVFRLHDYVKGQNYTGSINNQDDNLYSNEEIEFPNYNYPSHARYRGNKNCTGLIAQDNFNFIAQKIYSIDNHEEKYKNAVYFIRNKCFSTAQLMKIGSLLTEDYKLKFAKEAIVSVYDLDNFIEMKQIFNTPKARNEFMNFLGNERSSTVPEDNSCSVSDYEYKDVITTIRNEKFNTSKFNTAKHLVQTKECYTALQIKGIIDLFDYENSRLELAKFAYDFTKNNDDYYNVVSPALGFTSSRTKLLNYIESRKQ